MCTCWSQRRACGGWGALFCRALPPPRGRCWGLLCPALVLDVSVLGLLADVLGGGRHPSFNVLLRSDPVARGVPRCFVPSRFHHGSFPALCWWPPGCFQLLPIRNSAALSVPVQVTCGSTFWFLGKIPRSGTAGVTGWSVSQPFLHRLATPLATLDAASPFCSWPYWRMCGVSLRF